jgi:aspartyl-tRNA(Asn)/glutamyl-tRNA(Gln) amidotransferase subunit C
MALDSKTVRRIARLARVAVAEDELGPLAGELSGILTWVEQLNAVDTEGVEPMTSVVDVSLPMRDDVVSDGGVPEKILANAPEAVQGFFAVPKVVE